MFLQRPLTILKPWFSKSITSTTPRCAEMIFKTNSTPTVETKPFHLSFLDQNNVRVYTQTLSIFPVSSRWKESLLNLLTSGLVP
jgi:hypothetical protein